MSRYIDVIVPRGKRFSRKVQKFSKIHVIGHLEGFVIFIVDKKLNAKMAKKVILTQNLEEQVYAVRLKHY